MSLQGYAFNKSFAVGYYLIMVFWWFTAIHHFLRIFPQDFFCLRTTAGFPLVQAKTGKYVTFEIGLSEILQGQLGVQKAASGTFVLDLL